MAEQINKIVLIGPVYPFKGGISHYTGMMYRALSQKYRTIMISYQMQYPKLLFKKEQKDYANDSFKIEDTKYWIHTANPFNWILSAIKIKNQNPDLIIIQWWHPYFAPCYWMLNKLFGKTKKLFVCHNVLPHERFPMDRWLTKLALKGGNRFIVQSKLDANELKTILPDAVFQQTVHPTYNVFHFTNRTKESAREILEIEKTDKVLLFFGFVREYKGLKYLIQAMPRVMEVFQNMKLLIVGDFDKDKEKYLKLIAECNADKNIEIHDGYIPDKEVEKYFLASDLVVLPYESATQSGIVQIAYGFEKPVVVTRVGGLPDVVTDGETGYVVESRNPEKLAEAVIRFFQEKKAEIFCKNIKREQYKFSWDRMVEIVEELYYEFL